MTHAPKLSAGILLYRFRAGDLAVFLVHPGGPFWRKKDAGAWSLPKGEYKQGDDPLEAAKREFHEETGFAAPAGEYISLGELRQLGGKLVTAWAAEGDCAAEQIRSNTFPLEWPPKSGRVQQFPEVDRAGWFPLAEARAKILSGQIPFLDRLAARLGAG
jgi:predicted NUDIX family NTP pyrophosphohydrolase